MPRPPSRLVNCYVPLEKFGQEEESHGSTRRSEPAPETDGDEDTIMESNNTGEDPAMRGPLHLRPLRIQNFVTSSSAAPGRGSAYVELGNTKVLCQVQAPTPVSHVPSHIVQNMPTEQGVLYCHAKYAPLFAVSPTQLLVDHVNTLDVNSAAQQQQRALAAGAEGAEARLARALHAALAAAVPLQGFPRSVVGVFVTVLHDDGGALTAATAAASVALSRAQVPVLDLVTALQVGMVVTTTKTKQQDKKEESEKDSTWQVWVDPSADEMPKLAATLTMAWMPNRKMVTLWEQSSSSSQQGVGNMGLPPPETITKALQVSRQACTKVILPQMREHLLS